MWQYMKNSNFWVKVEQLCYERFVMDKFILLFENKIFLSSIMVDIPHLKKSF